FFVKDEPRGVAARLAACSVSITYERIIERTSLKKILLSTNVRDALQRLLLETLRRLCEVQTRLSARTVRASGFDCAGPRAGLGLRDRKRSGRVRIGRILRARSGYRR